MKKSEKFAISSIKRSIADRIVFNGIIAKKPRIIFQGVVDVRSMKPSLANTLGLNSVGDALSEDGWAFEDRCARILLAQGWAVEVTPGSGDYGAGSFCSSWLLLYHPCCCSLNFWIYQSCGDTSEAIERIASEFE